MHTFSLYTLYEIQRTINQNSGAPNLQTRINCILDYLVSYSDPDRLFIYYIIFLQIFKRHFTKVFFNGYYCAWNTKSYDTKNRSNAIPYNLRDLSYSRLWFNNVDLLPNPAAVISRGLLILQYIFYGTFILHLLLDKSGKIVVRRFDNNIIIYLTMPV